MAGTPMATTAPSSPVSSVGCKRTRGSLSDDELECTSTCKRGSPSVSPAPDDGLEISSSTSDSDAVCWGAHAICGFRPYMEDTHLAGHLVQLPGPPSHAATCSSTGTSEPMHLFAVFDGHGGSTVAEYLAANAESYIASALAERMASSSSATTSHCPVSNYREVSTAMAQALRDAFLALDRDVPTRINDAMGGSTAVCVLMDAQRLICANCGDSRAVLSRSDRIVALSDDHKPERKDEQERIQRAGGRIVQQAGGCARVMGMLSMTRAIGDTLLQRFGITPEPEVRIIQRSPRDEFLIVASDGLWGVMTSEDAVSITRRCLQRASSKGLGRGAATRIAGKVLVHAASRLGSRDNITVVVVDLAVEGNAASCAAAAQNQQHQQQLKVQGCSSAHQGDGQAAEQGRARPCCSSLDVDLPAQAGESTPPSPHTPPNTPLQPQSSQSTSAPEATSALLSKCAACPALARAQQQQQQFNRQSGVSEAQSCQPLLSAERMLVQVPKAGPQPPSTELRLAACAPMQQGQWYLGQTEPSLRHMLHGSAFPCPSQSST